MPTACSSAMPTSMKRSGNAAAKGLRPVPPSIAAVMATTFSSACASRTSAAPNTLVYDGALEGAAVETPVLMSKGPTPWKRSGSRSAGS